MILFDVNILLYAHREDSSKHRPIKKWLEGLLSSGEMFGYCDFVVSGFLRIATHPKIFNPPTPMNEALHFIEKIIKLPQAMHVQPGSKHWELFKTYCSLKEIRGSRVTDACLAALAVESGCEWVSDDNDFRLFSNLHWRRPGGPPNLLRDG